MDGRRGALLLVGVLNLVLLGAVACGERAEPDTPVGLTERVIRLEAWRALQDRITREHQDVLTSQLTLSRSFEAFMRDGRKHAESVDRSLEKQAEALRILNSILTDLLDKVK